MALKTRNEYYDAYTNIDTKELFKTSQLISKLSGMAVQRNKAIIGRNAFAHEAGIHQHGVIANKSTYEIMSPADIGGTGENIVIGKLSGKHAAKEALKNAGIDLNDEQLEQVSNKIKDLADKKKDVNTDDIVAIGIDVLNKLSEEEDVIKLDELTIVTGNRTTPTATVGLVIDGEKKVSTGIGVGPVNAATNAIKSIVGPTMNLKEYSLKAVTGGTDALANVAIKVEDDKGNIFASEAVDEDVIMASVKAILKGANKAMIYKKKKENGNN